MLNKVMLIEQIAEQEEITKASAGRALDLIFSGIAEETAKGEKVSIAGFGTFERVERAERSGRNPQTGEAMRIPASNSVHFRPAKALKDRVNR